MASVPFFAAVVVVDIAALTRNASFRFEGSNQDQGSECRSLHTKGAHHYFGDRGITPVSDLCFIKATPSGY
jgi:hypothetical protein